MATHHYVGGSTNNDAIDGRGGRPMEQGDQSSTSSSSSPYPYEEYLRILWDHRPSSKVVLLLTAFFAWTCTLLAVTKCTFFQQFDNMSSTTTMMTTTTTTNPEFGLFSKAIYDNDGDLLGCVNFSGTVQVDAMYKVGRAFGMISTLCSTIAYLLMCITIVFYPPGSNTMWKFSRGYWVASTLGTMFSFFVMGNHHCQMSSCSLSAVGILTVFNVIVSVVLSIAMCLEKSPNHPWLIIQWNEGCYDNSTMEGKGTLAKSSGQQTGWAVTSNNGERDDASTLSSQEIIPVLEMEPEHGTMILSSNESHTHIGSYGYVRNIAQPTISVGGSVQESFASSFGIQGITGFRLATMALVAFCWSVTIVGTSRCTFVVVGPVDGSRSDFSGLGLFSRAAYLEGSLIGCLAYPDQTEIDEPLKTARAFGVMASIIMTTVFLLATIQLCIPTANNAIWYFIRALLPCATIAQLLVFVIFRTNACWADQVECRAGGTGVVVILNVVLLVVLSILAFLLPPPPDPILVLWRDNTEQSHEKETPSAGSTNPTIISDLPPPEPLLNHLNTRNSTSNPHDLVHHPNQNQHRVQFSPEMHYLPQHKQDVELGSRSYVKHSIKTEPVIPTISTKDDVQTIRVQVEFLDNQKKTTKTFVHPDGSQTITTTVEELDDDSEMEEESIIDESQVVYESDTDGLATNSMRITQQLPTLLGQRRRSNDSGR